jgi:uncharacterized protein YdaU (DUF1376 family)
MSKAPFMPLATDALIADTTHLNTFEFGCYVKLLMAQWRNNGKPLENNHKRLSYMMGITKAQFNKVWPVISAFYLIDENTVSQQRLAKDFNIVEQKIEKNIMNGSKGGIAKAVKIKEMTLANGTVSLVANGYQPEPEPEPEPIKKKNMVKKGSRIAAEWKPSQSLVDQIILKEKSNIKWVEDHVYTFVNYWLGKTGRDATKTDWNATFRNWCANSFNRPESSKHQETCADFGVEETDEIVITKF